ncbi:hypothetical protein PV728_29460 [Streptomyces europaeiscabiei]|uniref:hypothetical protein n=1 Tax=Streptomyces europaeiscabiei TaxID=146819 RepID=UPI00299F9282|nr:hypothetical protein [Streptomyces europaeiscabiei]MDX3634319.1 hypothetical protein [Streptomyces europaeiscabiei]MDX3651833.1 hypothetical protein [Streptomyces europaeiscabiei]
MSQQHPQQPGWGHPQQPQQPGQGTPQPPPKKTPVGKVVGFSCLGIVVLFALLGIIGSVIGDAPSSTSKGTSATAADDKAADGETKDDAPAADPQPSKTAKEDAKPEEPKKPEQPTASATADRQEEKADAGKAAGIPPKPTGKERQALLDALAAAAPDVVRYEDKAIDAARNQCSAINGGAQRLNWSAAQRFTYKDVVTTEAQGKKINAALKDSGFCKV